jgi:recombination associated protein RdgC
MWFRNLTLYSFDSIPTLESLNAALMTRRYTPCTDIEQSSAGFVPPRGDDALLVLPVDTQWQIALCIEQKVLPGSVVRDETERRAAEVERLQGFKPGRKQRREIKDEATDMLLAQAFSRRKTVRGWIDTRRAILAIDTASTTTADLFVANLLRAIEANIGLRPLKTVLSPVDVMTAWVGESDAPDGFTIDSDATFSGSNRGVVKYSNTALEGADVASQIEAGKRVTRLAMTWGDKVSFVFSSDLVIRRVNPLDVLKEKPEDGKLSAAADFLLMAECLAALVQALVASLDGIAPVSDLADEEPAAPTLPADGDDLLPQARDIVIKNERASISLVQRHLRIGYNRAAALLEALEAAGVVSEMKSNGSRDVLAGAQA